MTAQWRVLVAGDANVDLILRGDVRPQFGQAEQLLTDCELVLGSSAGIAAAGLAQLGVPTSLVGCVGDDEFGRFTLRALSERGVGTGDIRVVPEKRTAISVILSAPDDRAILTDLGAIPELTAADVLEAARTAEHVHFASYFLTPTLAEAMPGVLHELRTRGLTTSLDTNWDPSERWTGVGELLPLVDYLLPNEHELRAIAASIDPALACADDSACARRLAEQGATVVVKAGAEGGWSMTPQGVRTSAPGLVLDPADTTGAGDSFDAGYLAAIGAGIDDERTRLRWAAVAGSLSTRANGGTAAQPTRDELVARVDEPGAAIIPADPLPSVAAPVSVRARQVAAGPASA
jgi:ribokinase